MANNTTLMRRQTNKQASTPQEIQFSPFPPKQSVVQPTREIGLASCLWRCYEGKCYMLYIFMCVYPWSSYFLSFQTNHWSLWDTKKTSSKQLHLESKQHHLGTQIIKELYEMSSDGKSYLKLVHVPSLFNNVWLCYSMDHSPPGSYVHGILQAIIQEWVAMLSSRGSSWPRDWTCVTWIAGGFFTHWATWKAPSWYTVQHNSFQMSWWTAEHFLLLSNIALWTRDYVAIMKYVDKSSNLCQSYT